MKSAFIIKNPIPTFVFNNVLKIFDKINKILPQINEQRKRIISVKYTIHRLFIEWGIDFEIKVTKSNKSLCFYDQYWNKIKPLLGDSINYKA